MASSMASALPNVTLSPPTLLRLYTLCVVATTASLAIWGPQLMSSIRDLARLSTTSNQEPQAESCEEQPTEEEQETTATENKPKKWKRKNQIWNYGWEDAEPPQAREKKDEDTVFVAIERTWGRNSGRDDYMWIEINSRPLTELLTFEFKHLEGLRDDDEPGLDARELYMARERLAELAALAPPEEEPQSEDENGGDKPQDSDDTKASATDFGLKDASDAKAEETNKTEPPKRSIFSDEPAPVGPELSKAEYDQALREIKLVLEFVMEEFHKVEEKLGKLTADGMISWNLLWAFLRRGQRLETTHSTTGEKMAFIMTGWDYSSCGGKRVFEITGRWLEWTGYRYAEQGVTRQIIEFTGLKKLVELPAQHLSDESFEELMVRGRMYTKYAGIHHLNYSSNIIQGDIKLRAEGRLMVDVASYRRMNPNSDRWDYDDSRHFSSRRARENMASSRTTIADDDKDLTLLPPTLHGYSFVAKAWGQILVEHLSPVPFQPHVFDHLVLREDYKSMIRSLVDAHAGRGDSALLTDVITGKGGGLIIVLHGKPGIGKTLTAEAVSEHLERPLYIVSSGELGVDPSYLERSLKDTLEVATIWKAVTLIDEADVFLEARSSHELQRNALVSVFLRVLEYHSGVLILTTNRIRAFDDAFLSRFSIALRYPDLDRDSRKVLWTKFLTMAGALVEGYKSKAIASDEGIGTPHTFSLEDIEKLSSWNLNGRVIKQSARTAQALAVSAGESLSMSHIDTVLKVSDQFAEDWKELSLEDGNPRAGSS